MGRSRGPKNRTQKKKNPPSKPEDGAPNVLTRRTNVKGATRKIKTYGPPSMTLSALSSDTSSA